MKYCIDTSSLLLAQRAYPAKIFPMVWAQLEKLISDGRLISSEEVLRELDRVEDTVAAWAKAHEAMFLPPVEPIQREVTKIMNDFPKLVDQRLGKSLADPWVVATAVYVGGCTVVSEEVMSGAERPKIPTVCAANKIDCIRLFDLIRREGWTFD